MPLTAKSFSSTALIHSNVKGPAKGEVRSAIAVRLDIENPASAAFATSDDGQDQSVTFQVTPGTWARNLIKLRPSPNTMARRYTEGTK